MLVQQHLSVTKNNSIKYNKTLEYLFDQLPFFQRIGEKAYKRDLVATINLLRSIDDPQKNFKSILIAGTNGKGSVSTLLSEIFRKNHYKVGLYTSLHFKDFRERIRISGKKIKKKRVIEFVSKNKNNWENLKPSFFEMTVAMAFDHFSNENVDIAIVEVGMGGRLDSTNVLKPELSVITRIGMDHQNFLGETIEEIAAEKGGIIKNNGSVVISNNLESVWDVLERSSKDKNAIMHRADTFDGKLPHHVPDYQRENIGTVLRVCELLIEKGWKLDSPSINEIINKTLESKKLKGRWQVLSENPLVIADAAHNENGVKALVQQLSKMDYQSLHIVLGMVNDKDIEQVLSMLPKKANYYFCKADIPRGLDANLLKDQATRHGLHGTSFTSVKEAFQEAMRIASAEDMLLVTGSIFTLAEVL